MKNSHNICSKMWTDTNINFDKKAIRHCCKQTHLPISLTEVEQFGVDVFERHPRSLADRRDMVIANQLPKACQWCINSAPNSIKDVWNEWSDDWIADNRQDLIDSSYVSYIELDIGRSCDMACVYCGPWSSTTWAKELGQKVNHGLDQEWKQEVLKHLSDYIRTVPAKKKLTFNILGGEPLLIPDTYDMIEYIAEQCGHFENRPILMITTNLNCKPKLLRRLLDTIEKTRDRFEWQISVSIENIGDIAEAVRYHLDWAVFESNMREIKDQVDRVYFTTTFSILSFSQFSSFIDWAFDMMGTEDYTQRWDFSLNSVQEGFTDIAYSQPEYVDLDHIKATYQKYVEQCDNPAQWRINQFYEHVDNLYERLGTREIDTRFIGFWQAMGKRRDIDYLDIYPLNKLSTKFFNAQVSKYQKDSH